MMYMCTAILGLFTAVVVAECIWCDYKQTVQVANADSSVYTYLPECFISIQDHIAMVI